MKNREYRAEVEVDSMLKNIFKRNVKPMEWGEHILNSSPFLGIVIPGEDYCSRMDFLERFTKKAYFHRLIKVKKPGFVNYWYDGPCGNIGVRLWEDGTYHQVKNAVIGISRLNIIDDKKTEEIGLKAVELLIKNNNIVLFLPNNNEEIKFYEERFPDAKKISYGPT